MKRIINLILQDTCLLLRNALFWVVTVSLLVIILSVRFLIPEDFNTDAQRLVSWNLNIESPAITSLESEQAVLESVKEEATVGFIQHGDTITLVHSGLSAKAQNALMTALFGKPSGLEIKVRSITESKGRIPENIRLTPVFICFEALISGFLMAGVLMLEEKEGKTIKAYRISPAGTLEYVTAKTILFGIIGTVYALLMAVSIIGFQFRWGGFILLAFVSSSLFTLLGLSLTVFFHDMSSWFSLSVCVLALNMLTMVSYSSPSFSPPWIRVIPSWPMLFAFEELMFGMGRGIGGTLLLVLAETAVLFILACFLVRKVLLKSERRIL
jgi:hypothetical protein